MIEVDVKELTSQMMTLKVRATGLKQLRIRMIIGSLLVRLAAWVMWCGKEQSFEDLTD